MDIKPSLSTLPDEIWTSILTYLSVHDLRNLLLVNRNIKQKTQVHLYHELTLTEWASSGARLARAIYQGTVSDETCRCIEKLRLRFTSMDEISEALRLSLEIQPRMPNISIIEVEAHLTEQAMVVVGLLAQAYASCQSIGLYATARGDQPQPIAYSVLPLLTTLRVPRLFVHEPPLLTRIVDLEFEELDATRLYPSELYPSEVHASEVNANKPYAEKRVTRKTEPNGAITGTVGELDRHVLDRLAVTYASYVKLGSPPCLQLEIMLEPTDSVVRINDAACNTLKLAATRDLPQIEPALHTPSLRVLILCNIAPLPTIRLFESNNLDSVEFLSIAPGTLPALQAVASQPVLPALHVLLVMIMGTSFLTATPTLHKRETRKIVEWLQMLASQYPVDVRDAGWLLRQDIYFSDGLWCLASQTRYRKYLHLVAPPPLKS